MADEDARLSISAIDRGAKRLIQDLVRHLKDLERTTIGFSKAQRESVNAARAEAQVLKAQAAAATNAVRAQLNLAEATRQRGRAEIAHAQEVAKRLERIHQSRVSREAAVNAASQRVADARVEQANRILAAEIKSQNAIVANVQQGVTRRIAEEKRVQKAIEDAAKGRELEQRERIRRAEAFDRRERSRERARIQAAKEALQVEKEFLATRNTAATKRVARVAVNEAEKNLNTIKEQAEVSRRSRRQGIEDEKAILATRQRANAVQVQGAQEALARSEAAGKREVAAARATADGVVAQARRKLEARLADAASQRKSTADVTKSGAQAIAAARRQGADYVATARRNRDVRNDEARAAVRAAREIERADRQKARSAAQAARQQEIALRRATQALQAQARAVPGLARSFQGLRTQVSQLVAAYAGFRVIEGFIGTGLKFNQTIESARLGIAALITAEATLTNAQGDQLRGTTALAAAQGVAADQVNKLRVAGIQTVATTEELITTFQEAVGAGLSVGLTLDQIRHFSVSVAQAASAINLPMNQLQQETRSILQGTIDRNSRIAKALQLTNAEVNLAKQQNRLADLLNEKFQAFNIAGAESVKTFAALKSNIADAFAVFAGEATQPLFTELRTAGQKALAAIFDFKTAEIRESFTGLVEGGQVIFREIGVAFSDAIRNAVERAEALSKWLKENREEVKQTAAAVGTMVREFSNMSVAIASTIQSMVTLGGEVNTVTGFARTLGALFETIRQTVGLIVGLLAGRALFTALGNLIVVIRAVTLGGAAGSIVPGVGTAIGSVIGLVLGLGTAYNLLKRDTLASRLEQARMATQLEDVRAQAGDLTAEFAANARALEDKNISEQDAVIHGERLNTARRAFIALGGQYARILNDENLSLKEQAEALLGIARAEATTAALREGNARDRARELKVQLEEAQKRAKPQTVSSYGFPVQIIDPQAKRQVEVLSEALQLAETDVNRLASQTDRLNESLKLAGSAAPTITANKPAVDPNAGVSAEDRRIKEAQARFDRAKAEIDAERAQFDALFTGRVITAQAHLEALLQLDIREIEAEGELIAARRAEAERKQRDAEAALARATKPDSKRAALERIKATEDEVRAVTVLEDTLKSKRLQKVYEFYDASREAAEQRAARELEIEQRFLRAQGREYDAATLEIRRKNEAELRRAVQESGTPDLQQAVLQVKPGDLAALQDVLRTLQGEVEKSPLVAKLVVAVNDEARREQLQAIQAEIQRVQQAATAETQAIEADFKRRGSLSSADRQLRADQITAVNQRAVESTLQLNVQLREMLALAQTDEESVWIRRLIAQLEALGIRAQEVDLELQRLAAGGRETLENGLGTFLENLTDASAETKASFGDMVRSMIADMNRLVSQMLSRKIVDSLLGFFGGLLGGAATSGSGQAVGNTTQSGGRARGGPARRAAGGPGRPAHGILRGGISGADSIPIIAMPDEWFVRREAVQHYGHDFMHMINNMQLPRVRPREPFRFAAGGSPGAQGVSTARTSPQEHIHRLVVDRRGLLDVLEGDVGRDITLNNIAQRSNSVGRVLRASGAL